MKTLVLQSGNPADLKLVIDLAQRLGMHCQEIDREFAWEDFTNTKIAEDEEAEMDDDVIYDENGIVDTSALYKGLKFSKKNEYTTFENLKESPDIDFTNKYNSNGLFDSLKIVGGAWENDNTETLEDLLNLLTK
jgi:hypothetical protein